MAKVKLDFSNVESFVKCEEGEHVARLKKIELKTASTGNEMFEAQFEVVQGGSTGATLYDNFVLTEKALWKLKSYLEVVGVKADGRLAVDTDKLIGKKCVIVVKDEEYNGRVRPRIQDYKKIKAQVDTTEGDIDDLEEDDWED